jgi:hypothetical protein
MALLIMLYLELPEACVTNLDKFIPAELPPSVKKGKFLWGTGLTPKHLGLEYGPLCPPNYRQFPPSSPKAPRTERCESLY